MRARILAGLTLVGALIVPAVALAHDEAVDGDLSSDAAAPTPLVFNLGTNVVAGRVTNAAGAVDVRDYITFTIPAGRQLTALRLVSWVSGNTGFHAINVGATSFVPSGATDNNFLGGDHVNPAIVAFDLVELLDGDTAGVGATAPLGPGTYSYVIQETGPQLSDYRIEFIVSAAPGPAAVPASDHKSLIGLTLDTAGGDAVRPPPLAPGRLSQGLPPAQRRAILKGERREHVRGYV